MHLRKVKQQIALSGSVRAGVFGGSAEGKQSTRQSPRAYQSVYYQL
jgi:hypothetical protein